MPDYKVIYNEWLNGENFDEETRNELAAISGDEREIEERFYKDLEFGTGGLRGIIGAGTNRMNVYTVRKATQGLANYILKQGVESPSAVVAFDSRRMSQEFARETALTLCANGIKCHVFESLRPTPELSFAVRQLGCTAGVMITASHNPPEYNGYKAYWSDGAQLSYPRDEDVINEANALGYADAKTMPFEEAREAGLFVDAGTELDDEFIACVKTQSLNPELESRGELSIVYTPLHGAGNIPVRRVLAECGYKSVIVVPEQEQPDPGFSTVGYPNPEDPAALTMAIKLAEEKGAELVLATDPDSDRVGVAARNKDGFSVLSGNMIGVLLTDYILSQRKEKGLMPPKPAVVSTVVSTRLTRDIAEACGAEYFEVLTGFKFIADRIRRFEESGSNNYVFGFEESIGYLPGTYARDKDAVAACLLICEMTVFHKQNGKTLFDALNSIYERFGYVKEGVVSIEMKGISGIEDMKKIMLSLRSSNVKTAAGKKLKRVADYLNSKVQDLELDVSYDTGLPVSDVLHYTLSDDSWFCIRPSGTEPKIKIYFGAKGKNAGESAEFYEILKAAATALIQIKQL